MNRKVYIIDAKRTAIGKFLGSLYESDPSDVCSQVIRKGFENKYFDDIDIVIIGNVVSAGMGQGIARKIAIKSGIPERVPAYSLNMVCGSGMEAVRNAAMEIQCGSDLVLAGGLEFMSNIPFATNTYMRLGKKFGDFGMTDLMTHDGLIDSFSGVHMGITAENVAKKYGITREAQDEYALKAQQRAVVAVDGGFFKEEIVPVELKDYKGRSYTFDTDEFPRRDTSLEKMAKLPPTFLKDGTGTVTAANTSGINDGAAFMLIASEDYCKKNKITPLAEIVDTAIIGCDPQYMGLGPYYAITKLMQQNPEMEFSDIDYFDINEAFVAQVLGSMKLLAEEFHTTPEYIIDRCNVWGSGIGLGHPLGMTGARSVGTLAHILQSKKATYGIASLCIGGGMGAATLIKRVDKDTV